jgi:hypothetical protein
MAAVLVVLVRKVLLVLWDHKDCKDLLVVTE